MAELYGTTLVPPGSAHEFAGVLRSGARRRDGDGAERCHDLGGNGKFRVGNERIEPKTISATPKRGVRRFKWVPHDLNHLGLGGAENRLGLQKRGLEVEMLKLQYLGRG